MTFTANYLTTTLPSTMGANDLEHEVQVEDQVVQLGALLQQVAQHGVVGAQVSGPVTLGSQGAPPFAAQDSASLTGLSYVNNQSGNYPQTIVTFNLSGPSTYAPPTGFGLSNVAQLPSGCTLSGSTSLTCPAINRAHPIAWNFSGGDSTTYTVTLGTGGNLVTLNFATNHSTISISGISGMPIFIQIYGSNDTLSLSNNGGGNNPISINITGNYDTVASGSFPGGASTILIHVIGNRDYINGDPSSGGNTMLTSFVGSNDTLNLVPGAGSTYYTYFTGFDSFHPTSPYCPYGALALTDSVTGYTVANGASANAHLTQSFNNSTAYPTWGNLTPSSRWSIHYHPVNAFACPYVTGVQVPVAPLGSAGFVVHLANTYAPPAEVAYDQGAVLFAQPGGIPIFASPPPVSYSGGLLQMFIPLFANSVSGESSVGTADISARLLAATSLTLPSNGYSFVSNSKLNITVVTSYASAWQAYFQSVATLSPYLSPCTGSNHVCTVFANTVGPLGTVKLSLPTTGLTLKLVIGLFAISVS